VVVFGFAGLRFHEEGWTTRPRLPAHWTRLSFKFFHKGEQQIVELTKPATAPEPA
jgi:trehalose/maltose hydrolase-like predicted phosphorylase